MRLILSLLALAVVAACTDADLVPVSQLQVFERQRFDAVVCAPEPSTEDLPYKILFVIDTSLSNAWNDPNGYREQAVRNAITELIHEETVSFGIVTFSDEPRRQTFGFTRDLEVLDGAIENIGDAQGGTNYNDTLWVVIDFITDDLGTLTTIEAARTHYLIYWLSDGFPTVGVTEPASLLPAVDHLFEQTEDAVAEVTFNTAFLGAGGEDSQAQIDMATGLLEDMAEVGNGTFTSINAGEAFEFDISLDEVLHEFEFAFALASNRHTTFDIEAPRPDSDADSLTDELEIILGLDPTLADTDGDGYRDGVELAAAGSYDPLEFNHGCAEPIDSDGDGLFDCEETIVGTIPTNPDSDDDLMLDSFEVWMGTSPAQADQGQDTDLDNIPNPDELRFHLPPVLPNTDDHLLHWAYRYEVTELVETSAKNAPPCYRLTVDNMLMTETMETPAHPAGGNAFEVVVAFRSAAATRFVRATRHGRVLLDYDLWDPPHGVFHLAPEDFVNLTDDPDAPSPEPEPDPPVDPDSPVDPDPPDPPVEPNPPVDPQAEKIDASAAPAWGPMVGTSCSGAMPPAPLGYGLWAIVWLTWRRRSSRRTNRTASRRSRR